MIEPSDIEGVCFQLDHAEVPAGELAAVIAPTAACAREFTDVLLGFFKSPCATSPTRARACRCGSRATSSARTAR